MKMHYYINMLFQLEIKILKNCAYNIAMKNLSVSELSSGPGEFTIDKLKYEDIQHVCFFYNE